MQKIIHLTQADGQAFIDYLQSKGFRNVHNVMFDELQPRALVVDADYFYPANTTCLAAFKSCGLSTISTQEFKSQLENKKNLKN